MQRAGDCARTGGVGGNAASVNKLNTITKQLANVAQIIQPGSDPETNQAVTQNLVIIPKILSLGKIINADKGQRDYL